MYNNHNYLLLLIGIIMFLLPANSNYSLDAKIFPKKKKELHSGLVHQCDDFPNRHRVFFAAIAKLYPGWLDGAYMQIMLHKQTLSFCPGFYQQRWLHYFLVYSGFLFDLLIVPLLLWNRTRIYAFAPAILFHTFNSIHLNIGIFPFFALSFSVFFYPPSTIRKIFFRSVIPQTEELIRQIKSMKSSPDMIWQTAQKIMEQYA